MQESNNINILRMKTSVNDKDIYLYILKKTAKAAAEAVEESGLGIGKFNKLPESQDDLEVGEYYIKKDGSVRRFDGEKLLTPSDEGFK